MKKIASRLRLSDEASEDSILVEVDKYLNRADITPAKLAELQTEIAALRKTNEELAAAQVEVDLEKYSNRIKPEAREKWKNRLLKDRTGTIELLEDMAEIATEEGQPAERKTGKVLNRADAGKPESAKRGKGGEDEQAKANKIKCRADELKAANPTRLYDSCWKQAASEVK